MKPKALHTINLNIETWADIDSNTWMCWGDSWVKIKLARAFESLGCNVGVAPQDADVTIYLWGNKFPERHEWPFFYNPNSYNIAWFYSHPDIMDAEEMSKYNMVFCLSEDYLPKVKEMARAIPSTKIVDEPLLSCTDFRPPRNPLPDNIDILFIGNARGGSIRTDGRKVVRWLKVSDKIDVRIFGAKWQQEQFDWMRKWYAGQYWEYERLNEIYATAKIVLVDGHEDMQRHGFVQMKIFDVLASGGFALSDYNSGIPKIFGATVPMFKNAEEMNRMIKHFLNNESERKSLANNGGKIARNSTFKDRARKILTTFSEELGLVNTNFSSKQLETVIQ